MIDTPSLVLLLILRYSADLRHGGINHGKSEAGPCLDGRWRIWGGYCGARRGFDPI